MNPKLSIFPRFERPRAFNRPKRGSLSHAFQLDKIPKNAIRLGSIGVEIQDCKSPIGEIEEKAVAEWALAVVCDEKTERGRVWKLANDYMSSDETEEDVKQLRREIATVFYRTGIAGLPIASGSEVRWADNESYSVSPAELNDETAVTIHPGLWRVLGIKPV